MAELTSKGARTRLTIIESASDLFWRRGFHNVSVDEIALHASVNKATIYRYFESKDQLAEVVIDKNRERTLQCVFEGAFRAASGPKDRIRQIYQRVFEAHSELYSEEGNCFGCPFVNIGMELGAINEPIRVEVAKSFNAFASYYRQLLSNTEEAAPQTLGHRANALVGVMNAAMVAAKIEQRPEAILDFIEIAEGMLDQ